MDGNMVLILDAGGANAQLVARIVRTAKVYCEVLPISVPVQRITDKAPAGLIVTGGVGDAAPLSAELLALDLPILGLGYGARALNLAMGGAPGEAIIGEELVDVPFAAHPLFEDASGGVRRIDRADTIKPPEGVSAIAQAQGVIMAFASQDGRRIGLQFTPEQNDLDGLKVMTNFVTGICGLRPTWTMRSFIDDSVAAIRAQVGGGRALLAMSGGVDSSVCAALMHRAIGERLHCIYVNTGLMRLDESEEVEHVFRDGLGINLTMVDAGERFLTRLRGVTDPEQKRLIVGEEFIRVFEEEARRIGAVDFLVQGTIYPDVIESGVGGPVVKSHHNVGGLPAHIEFKELIEPLRELFKDEVRLVGELLELPPDMVHRQPFPGPGLAVRCLGEVTREKLDTLRKADAIFRDEIEKAGLNRNIWQYFAILTNMRSTGVRNDARSYDSTVALRAIHSVDAMTATAVRLPYDLLERVVSRITTEVTGVNRVVYDITGKPPATIEYE